MADVCEWITRSPIDLMILLPANIEESHVEKTLACEVGHLDRTDRCLEEEEEEEDGDHHHLGLMVHTVDLHSEEALVVHQEEDSVEAMDAHRLLECGVAAADLQ